MNLQQTVSKILEREVSIEEAKTFVSEQYGVLTTYNREWDKKVITRKETRVYIVNGQDTELIPEQLSNELFMEIAEQWGRVYSLQGFQDTFNNSKDEVNHSEDSLRFLTVPIFGE